MEPLKQNIQTAKGEKAPDKKEALREELNFMRRPIYYVIVFTGVVFAYNLVMFSVTVVDHAMGRGLSKLAAATLLSCYGGGELVGRFCSGILSDKKLCHRRDIMAMGFFLMSLSLVALIYANSMPLLGAASVLFGLTGGSIMILFSVLLVEYFGLKKLPMAIGIHCLVNGLSALPRPLIIGFYRDRGSSYNGMYMLLAAISLITSLLWAIECFVKWRAEKAQADQCDDRKLADRKPDSECAT
ncbi:monocarboxylate transporter 5-like [Amblyomma americanum]